MAIQYNKLKRGARVPKELSLLPIRLGFFLQPLFLYFRPLFRFLNLRAISIYPLLSHNVIIKHISRFISSLYQLRCLFFKPKGVVNLNFKYSFLNENIESYSSKLVLFSQNRIGTNVASLGCKFEIFPPFVEIRDSQMIDYVFNNGSFGKGKFSRSYPCSSIEEEPLQLDIYEANFLTSGIDALNLEDKFQYKVLPETFWRLSLLWGEFISSPNLLKEKLFTNPRNEFLINYVAYHYFRSQKWVVKSGLKYSSNFVLYKDGPMYRHSEFAVFVKGVAKLKATELSASNQLHFTWQEIFNMSRLCFQVKKKPLICYVFYPESISSDNIELCLSSYEVNCFQFERWNPSKTRE